MNKLFSKIQYGPSFQGAQIKESEFRLSPACAALAGRSLLFLSDVHLSRRFPERAVGILLDQIAALRPDMILLGGDYAESAEWQLEFFDLFSRLTPPLGAYGVLGNNDTECFPEDSAPLIKAAENAGVQLLVDRTVRISAGTGAVSIAGIDNLRIAQPLAAPLFDAQDDSSLRIMLAHYPQSIGRYLREHPSRVPHLAASGHTHGGQFRLFGLTPYSIGFECGFKGEKLPAVSGWSDLNQTRLLVSEGLGTSRIPIRINVPPAIHLIRLVK